MNLDEYQAAALETAMCPRNLVYPALGICGEVGEFIQSAITHCPLVRKSKELGDILWYVAMTASDMNLKLSKVMERKTATF